MSLLKRNIDIKGSASSSKCNIFPYSNFLNKLFMHNNASIQARMREAILGWLPAEVEENNQFNFENGVGITDEFQSLILTSWQASLIFTATIGFGFIAYWVAADNYTSIPLINSIFPEETESSLFYENTLTICDILKCSSGGQLSVLSALIIINVSKVYIKKES